MPVKIRKIFLFSLEGLSLWDTFIQCQKFVPFLQVVPLFYLLVQYTENNQDLSNNNNKKSKDSYKPWCRFYIHASKYLFLPKYHVHVYKKNQIVEKPCLCPGIYMKITLNGVLFPHKGIVPSSVVLTAFQVASRLFLTWAVAHSVPQVSIYQIFIMLAWCA